MKRKGGMTQKQAAKIVKKANKKVEEPKTVGTDQYFEQKRATEIGNTFYLKAKEHTETETMKIKRSYMNE